jgi:ABC-type antimicrobial peptide transport system permease subunit
LTGAIAATGALRGLFFGVGPTDPATFIVIALLVAGVALLSAYLSTRRALGVDPMEALPAE